MYHIVKDVASLITMSLENSLTALSLRVLYLQTRRVNTSELGQLTCLKGVVNCQNSRDKGSPEGNSARG